MIDYELSIAFCLILDLSLYTVVKLQEKHYLNVGCIKFSIDQYR